MKEPKDSIQFLIEAEEEKLRKKMSLPYEIRKGNNGVINGNPVEVTKIEWPEDQLDYSDNFTIKVTKVKFDGEFTHWEADLSFAEDGRYCEVTAPDMVSAIDEVMNYLYDSVYEWTKDDANDTR